MTTTTPGTDAIPARNGSHDYIATCPACGQTFTRVGRRIWCSDACKQAAWRRRNPPPAAAPQLPPSRHRRDHTVYECGECGQRQTGRQWCDDCGRPCKRLGPGGDCPACGEAVALSDLIPGA